MPKFTVIDASKMDADEAYTALMDALDIKPGATVELVMPQFERPPDMPGPGWMPTTRTEWEWLRTQTVEDLKGLGLGSWDGRLMLFPREWYAHIPAGFMFESISGQVKPFEAGVTDDNYRFGCLAYGVPAIDGVTGCADCDKPATHFDDPGFPTCDSCWEFQVKRKETLERQAAEEAVRATMLAKGLGTSATGVVIKAGKK